MNKKLLLTTFLFFAIIGISNAQLQKGNFMLGSDLGSGLATPTNSGLFSMNFGLNKGAGFDLGLSPKAGYFFSDNFVGGAILNLGFTKSPESNGESTKTTVYGIQAFTRFYIRPSKLELDNVKGNFFMETNAGIAGVNVTNGATTNGFAFGFGPGYSYFVSPSIALEANVKYNGLVGGGNTTYQNSLGINLGIQIIFPRSDAENAIKDFKN